MADVSYFNLSEQELVEGEEEHEEQFDRSHHVLDLDSLPYWSHDFDIYPSDPHPPPHHPPPSDQPHFTFDLGELYDHHHDDPIHRLDLDDDDVVSDPESVSITTADLFDRGNQVNFVMDLFQERVEQSHVMGESDLVSETISGSGFGVVEGNGEMGSNDLELDLGLGLGFGVDRDENFGFMVAESVDDVDFFVASSRRRRMVFGSEIETDDDDDGESSTICGPEPFLTGLRIVEIESDSDGEEDDVLCDVGLGQPDDFWLAPLHEHDDVDTGLNICWDSLQLDDGRIDGDEEDHREANEDFEWEEVDGRIDERDFFSMVLDGDEEGPVSVSVSPANQSEEEVNIVRVGGLVNFEWEVLLTVDPLERNRELEHDSDPFFGDHDDYIHTAEYEMLFGQFAENENALIGRPPASKSVVENLHVVVMTQEDVANTNALCAVCKDEMNVGESAKQLPCLHRYHGDCILPWLCIRNTCPVCRYELPTDDADYDRRRTQRAGRGM